MKIEESAQDKPTELTSTESTQADSAQSDLPKTDPPQSSIQKKVVIAALILIPLIGLRIWIGNRQSPTVTAEKSSVGDQNTNPSDEQTGVNPVKEEFNENLKKLLQQLTAATNQQNLQAALQIVHLMRRHITTEADKRCVQGAISFVRGLFAYYKREYPQAAQALLDARKQKVIWSDKILAQCFVQLSHQYWSANNDQEAMKFIRLTRQLVPNDLIAIFNSGVAEWHLSRQSGETGNAEIWKNSLQTFEKHASANTEIPLDVVYIAQSILNGSYNQRPPLLRPQEPAANLGKLVDALRKAEAEAIRKAKERP